ncbi:MAG: hypothetical protein NTX82_07770 [Candidatus Parcubacteria bacterium]|nr:hypothetical protein [Candidatus Parcubacteria bacterium]
MEQIAGNKNGKLKNILIGLGVVFLIGYLVYYSLVRTTNEIGFLGADKSGRQVLIQTLDDYLKPDVKVDSDFYDHSFLSRMLIQEPMRTTIRFDIQNPQNKIFFSSAESFLSQSNDEFVKNFKEKIFMQEGYEITPRELQKRLEDKEAKTMEDFLAGFGFNKFQMYEKGKYVSTFEIKGTRNVYWAGN